jgi:hypothetical protein
MNIKGNNFIKKEYHYKKTQYQKKNFKNKRKLNQNFEVSYNGMFCIIKGKRNEIFHKVKNKK